MLRRGKCMIFALSVTLLSLFLACSALAWHWDYRYWSQGESGYWLVQQYGCWVVAQAKMLYETGIDRSINPDSYAVWEVNNGLLPNLTDNLNQVDGGNAPSRYAATKGASLHYFEIPWRADDDQLWFNINAGYYTIVQVNNGGHYVYLDNEMSKATGLLYCDDSSTDNYYRGPRLLSSYGGRTQCYAYRLDSLPGGTTAPAQPSAPVTPQAASGSWTDQTTNITETNALLKAVIDAGYGGTFTQAAITVWDSKGTVFASKTESIQTPSSYLNIWYDVNGELGKTLSKGTKYTYQFSAIFNGTQFFSPAWTLTTAGTAPAPAVVTPVKPSTPAKPVTPAKPTTPAKPSTPSQPVKRDTWSVKVGGKNSYSAVYKGKAIRPSITVYNSKKQKVSSSSYKVTWKNNKNIGIATVKVSGTGSCSGITASAQFKITPPRVILKSVKSPKKKQVSLVWKKTRYASGYQVYCSRSKAFSSGVKKAVVKKASRTKLAVKNLTRKKIWYVKVRAYKNVSGKRIYGPWSTAKKVRVR